MSMASSKEDKNTRGNAPGAGRPGPHQANTGLQILQGFSQGRGGFACTASEQTNLISRVSGEAHGPGTAFLSAGITSGTALAPAQPSGKAAFHPSKEADSKEPGNKVCGSFHGALVSY